MFLYQRTDGGRHMDSIRKENREAAKQAAKETSVTPLPGITTNNAATKNRWHRNRLSKEPIQSAAVVGQSRALQTQAQQSVNRYGYGTKTPPSAVTPRQHHEPSALDNAPVAAMPHPEALPVAAATPDMERRVRKRVGKTILKGKDLPVEKLKGLKRVYAKLIAKDSATSLALTDVEEHLEGSQEAADYLEQLCLTPES
jgi:hypothetical protein